MSRISSSIAHSALMPYSKPQSLLQPQPQYPSGLGSPQLQYYKPPVHYQRPTAYHQPQQFHQQVEAHYSQMDMPFVWTQPQYYQPSLQYPPQGQFSTAWTSYPQQQDVGADPSNYTQPAPISHFRHIRPKPPTFQIPQPPLSDIVDQTRPPLPPPSLILNSEPKLDVLLQPFTKRRRPKRPQQMPSRAHPSQALLPLEPQALQSAPTAVKLGTIPAGIGDLSIAANAANPIQSRPQAQVSQLALPMLAAQPEVPVPSYPAFTLPRLTLPSQLPRVNHHEYLSQPTAALNYGYSSPELPLSVDLPHPNQPLPGVPPKPLRASQARSILQVPMFAEPSEIRAAYWSLEFQLHPDRHRNERPAIQSITAEKLAKAQEAVDKLRGFIGTCWDLERDFEEFRRME